MTHDLLGTVGRPARSPRPRFLDRHLDGQLGGHGTNTISRILGGRVVEEVFESHSEDEGSLYGRSHSVLDSADGRWRQTWVDSAGAYLDFVGVEADGLISFQRTVTVEGGAVLQRMVWLDVTADGFRWEWQRSSDAAATWSVQWPLDYRRAPAGEDRQPVIVGR